jgi:hypothetical protein
MSEEREKKADLFRELTLDVYHRIIESNNVVDSKIHNMLALAIGLMPLILGVFYYVARNGTRPLPPYPLLLFLSLGIGVVLFIVAIMIGVWSYTPKAFSLLRVHDFVNKHKDKNLADVKEITVATLGDIVKSNWEIVDAKANRFKLMLWFFTIGTVAFAVGFMLLLTTILN